MSNGAPGGSAFLHDAFVAFCQADRDAALGEVVRPLRAAGLQVRTQDEDAPGGTILGNLQEDVERSRHTIAVVTRHYLADELSNHIDTLAQTLDPAARAQRYIPLFFEDFEAEKRAALPLNLRVLRGTDFTDPDQRGQMIASLLEQLGLSRETIEERTAACAQRGVESLRFFLAEPEVRGLIKRFCARANRGLCPARP